MFHGQFFVYFSVIPLIVSVSYIEIVRFLSVIEIYIKMSEILFFLLSALTSQMAPYLIFILLQKSSHPVNNVLSSQNARLCRNCALIRPTISISTFWAIRYVPFFFWLSRKNGRATEKNYSGGKIFRAYSSLPSQKFVSPSRLC